MNETTLNRVEETLQRLGIEELEERLELSPIVAAGGDVPVDADGCCSNLCTCEVTVPMQVLDPTRYR